MNERKNDVGWLFIAAIFVSLGLNLLAVMTQNMLFVTSAIVFHAAWISVIVLYAGQQYNPLGKHSIVNWILVGILLSSFPIMAVNAVIGFSCFAGSIVSYYSLDYANSKMKAQMKAKVSARNNPF